MVVHRVYKNCDFLNKNVKKNFFYLNAFFYLNQFFIFIRFLYHSTLSVITVTI